MADLSGTTLGQYQIVNELGVGGMATVYRGMQTSVDREVAIKVLPTHFLQDRTFLERFEREVRVIAHLQHPRIVPVIDFGEEEGRPYIVMAMMHGGTLSDRLRKTPNGFSLDQTLQILDQVAEGLDFAHKRGVVHRDLKPGNILFDGDDNVFLSDFGIAKVSETTAHLTGSGIIGTPTYMAPELAERGTTSPLVDVYALGVTLFQMVTGKLPYDSDTPLGVLLAHANNPIPEAHEWQPDLPPDIQTVIEGAMAKNPAERYQSAGAMIADLRRVMNGESIEHYVTSPMAVPAAGDDQPYTKPLSSDELGFDETAPAEAVENSDTSPARPRSRPVWLLGLGAVLLIVAAAALVLTGIIPLGGAEQTADQPVETVEQTEAPTEAVEEAPTGIEAVTPTAVTLQPEVEAASGLVEWQSATGSFYSAISNTQPLTVGDRVRTDAEGMATLTFATGVYVEVLGGSEVSFDRYEVVDGRIVIEVRQFTGKARYTILPELADLELDFVLHTPQAVVYDLGTIYWAEEQEAGWCFKQVDGSILIELGEADENTDDDHLLLAGSDAGLLLTLESVLGECVVDETELQAAAVPTPTAAAGGGAAGGSGGGSSAATSEPTTTGSTLCAANGGVQWTGTTCVCPGFVDEVTVCADGTKLDTVTNVTCVPTSSCDAAGGGGGGGAVSCNAPLQLCNGTCVDLLNDNNNCGECGRVCSSPTPKCVGGACT